MIAFVIDRGEMMLFYCPPCVMDHALLTFRFELMASQRELKKLREILKAIEQGSSKFASAYSFLDQLEGKPKEDDSEEMIEDCIRPIQKMLQSNRQALVKLR
jgi:hypothetical protein